MAVQQRAADTRASILAAATACLVEHGYDATSVVEICRRAGVSKGAFYHHFPSKHDLFLELLNRWLTELDGQLEATGLQALSVPEGLLAMATTFQQVFGQARGQLPMFLEFWTQSARDATVWQATIEPYHRYRDFLARLVANGVAEGSLRPVDPASTARLILALVIGVLLQGLLDPDGTDWGRLGQTGMTLLLDGMRQDTAGAPPPARKPAPRRPHDEGDADWRVW